MAREPIATWFYSLVAVRQGDRALVLQESKHGQGWYLPAGRCEAGERLTEAAVRECLEETGVAIVLDGILRIEHEVYPTGARVRVIFVGRPAPGAGPPKTHPDEHSLAARWVTLDELRRLPRRHDEVLHVYEELAAGAPVAPLATLVEGGGGPRG